MADNKAEQQEQPKATSTDDLQALRDPALSEPIEELLKLLSQSKRVFLLGAGCSKCAGLPLMAELTADVMERVDQKDPTHGILQALVSQFSGARGCTIEDYMSELVDLVAIAERREVKAAKQSHVQVNGIDYSAKTLREALASIKLSIRAAIVARIVSIGTHRAFVEGVHGRLESGKSGPLRPVDYFTLNYDTLLEDALCLERVPLADGFCGGATGWWNVETYDDNQVRARVFKVHGSIDWCLLDDDVLPRRVRPGLQEADRREPVLIWPASTKYREAQRDPHAQIIDVLRHTLRPPQSSEVVLTIAGYSFGDKHINEELDRALRESDGRLTIIVFTDTDEPTGLVAEWYADPTVAEHVRIYANRGFFHADKAVKSKDALLWWKFEVLVRLLGGDR